MRQFEYLHLSTLPAGIRLIVHHARTMPFPETKGVYLAPGYHTAVSVTKVSNWSLGARRIVVEGQPRSLVTLEGTQNGRKVVPNTFEWLSGTQLQLGSFEYVPWEKGKPFCAKDDKAAT